MNTPASSGLISVTKQLVIWTERGYADPRLTSGVDPSTSGQGVLRRESMVNGRHFVFMKSEASHFKRTLVSTSTKASVHGIMILSETPEILIYGSTSPVHHIAFVFFHVWVPLFSSAVWTQAHNPAWDHGHSWDLTVTFKTTQNCGVKSKLAVKMLMMERQSISFRHQLLLSTCFKSAHFPTGMCNTVLNTYLEQFCSLELLVEWQLLSQKKGNFVWFSGNKVMWTSKNIPLHFHK